MGSLLKRIEPSAIGRWVGIASLVLVACRPDPTHPSSPPPPPPLPVRPEVPTPTPEPTPTPAEPEPPPSAGSPGPSSETSPKPAATAANSKAHTGASLYELVKRGEASMPSTPAAESTPPTKPAAPSAPPKPVSAAPTPPPPPPAPSKPATKVAVPRTDHVRVDVPSALQADLDRDPRMQPWVNQVIKVIDDCYAAERAKSAAARGAIVIRVIMHDAARPDADVKSLPPQLSGVVACATGRLMRIKMPLFTGTEGQAHQLSVNFEP